MVVFFTGATTASTSSQVVVVVINDDDPEIAERFEVQLVSVAESSQRINAARVSRDHT